jgi:hypothetical protein
MTDVVLKGEQEKGAVPVLCSTSRLLDVSLRCSPEYTYFATTRLLVKFRITSRRRIQSYIREKIQLTQKNLLN